MRNLPCRWAATAPFSRRLLGIGPSTAKRHGRRPPPGWSPLQHVAMQLSGTCTRAGDPGARAVFFLRYSSM